MAELDPLTPSRTRSILESLGHRPIKALGQNFLIDSNIVRKSLKLARLEPGDTIVEIGPGLGTLTRALLQADVTVHAIEQDTTLARYLEDTLGDHPHFHLIHGDACRHPLADLAPDSESTYKIVANLPYAISSPWMEGVLQAPVLPERIVILVQREMADRMTASPGSKSVGALTLFLESCFERLPGHRVAATCFYPRPGVDSTLFHLQRRADPSPYREQSREAIRKLFTQRRKQVGTLATRLLPPEVAGPWLQQLDDPKARPEALSFSDWKKLDHCFRTASQ